MSKHGKKYTDALKKVEESAYPLDAATKLAKEIAFAKFDEAFEFHVNTLADPRHADQQIRSVLNLPHGTGKKVRVLVFADGDAAKKAAELKAEYIADEPLIKKIEEGWDDFEVAIATRSMMPKIAKLGRYLGRKGLMPNPKSGTVVDDDGIESAINSVRAGRLEIKMDKNGSIHLRVGLTSFSEENLVDNISSAYDLIVKNKPEGIKGQFVKSASISTTMGPNINLSIGDLDKSVNKV